MKLKARESKVVRVESPVNAYNSVQLHPLLLNSISLNEDRQGSANFRIDAPVLACMIKWLVRDQGRLGSMFGAPALAPVRISRRGTCPWIETMRLTTKKAAAFLGLSPWTLIKWRSLGKGPAWMKVGARIFYPQEILLSFLDECLVEPSDRG